MQIKDLFRLHRNSNIGELSLMLFDAIDAIEGYNFNPADYDFNEFGGECAYSFLGVEK